ncbi:class I SAM-dependent DNA methyltransferase [Deinococcus budaensis]|uniref:site-specific DNA-methyltransferase (adenine-specific) n=1 Tax=Deinococcus budaensis TaxID=1665626 RepID=A0A7W8LQD4_9DEIO|nr:class I SAM-dependent DNA methyltransferase [Deinococcus budaensis]MBB5234500.1 type II restriction/modification system DNA methylase subunit YeeA [Deinococcus budaensis]
MSRASLSHQDFAQRWHERAAKGKESADYPLHWTDLCRLVDHPTPQEAPPEWDYGFQRSVRKVGTRDQGFADVFKAGHFIAEYKGFGKDLGAALQQATLYARELGSPPLIITSDMSRIEVNTAFTGTSPKTYRVTLDDVASNRVIAGSDFHALDVLHSALWKPETLDPRLLRERVTTDATRRIGAVARALTARTNDRTRSAHLMMRLVFAMFAEDVGLLERGLLSQILERARQYPERSLTYFQELFTAMQHGGEFWGKDVRHFNGGLFDSGDALAITAQDAEALLAAAQLDWAEVEPSIFGALFEDSLDTAVRSKRGAHYTSVTDIERIVDRVVLEPLWREWHEVKTEIAVLKRPHKRVERLLTFQQRLAQVRVLDPACGSGNFLFVALKKLLDLEHEVRAAAFVNEAGPFDIPPLVHPRQMLGIEIEPFAHELASITLWIGYFQWKRAHGGNWETPVLQRLDGLQRRDALLTPEGTEAAWPAAEFIVGNPPFLGDKFMRQRLGGEYTLALRGVYGDRLPAQSDLACYWPEKARAAIAAGSSQRAGFVATNSIRGGKNRTVLERIKATGDLFMAWPDEPWAQDGAAVRVSLFAFDGGQEQLRTLNGQATPDINADLSARADVNRAEPLVENRGTAFVGAMKKGKFDIPGALARQWLQLPNPDGACNGDVLKPWVNGMDLTRTPSDRWIVDFNLMTQAEAARYLAPYEYVRTQVKPDRDRVANRLERERWWQHARTAPDLRQAIQPLPRFIGIPRVAKHLLPVWLTPPRVVDGQVVVVARDDDFTFGVLASSIHRTWARAQGTYMGVGNDLRYTPSTCFETFPFPRPAGDQRAEVEKWARYVVQLREHLLAQDEGATLTGLYNAVAQLRAEPDASHPAAALATAHDRLDASVAAAYGWEWSLSEDEVLARLLALNLERASAVTAPA